MIKLGPYIEKRRAKEIGSTYYMTGRPCKNGHIDRKLTSSNKCESCKVRTDARRVYEAAWKRKKREDAEFVALEKKRREAWIAKDGVLDTLYEKNREYQRDRYANDEEFRVKKAEHSKQWAVDNPEKVRKKSKKWADANPDKVRMANHRRRGHRSITEGRNLEVDIRDIFKRSFGFCVYCADNLFDGYHLDHIMPLALGGTNEAANLQCICAKCNLRKGAKHPDTWHEELEWHTEPTQHSLII